MFEISVETHFNASHELILHDGLKEPKHNHNWSITAIISSEKLNNIGIVMDFHAIKKMLNKITARFENKSLNDFDYFRHNNPSAENVAKYIFEQLEPQLPKNVKLAAIGIIEEPGCKAKYYK